MQYVLRETFKSRINQNYYVYSDSKICHKLKNAKVFKSISEVDNFMRQHNHWTSTYKIIVVTEKDLFKAKLADQ